VLGGAFPSAATLAGDYAPQRLRVTLIMATFTGAPFGGFVGCFPIACPRLWLAGDFHSRRCVPAGVTANADIVAARIAALSRAKGELVVAAGGAPRSSGEPRSGSAGSVNQRC